MVSLKFFIDIILPAAPGPGVDSASSRVGGPECSRKLRFPDYVTMVQGGGKVVSLTHRPLLAPGKCSWYSFLLEAESTPGP